jgi:hypothetical protein
MYKFLDAYHLPKLCKEDINHLNRPISITNNETEEVIQVSQERKDKDWMDHG